MKYTGRHGHTAIIARDIADDLYEPPLIPDELIICARVFLLWPDGHELRINPAVPHTDPIAALVSGHVGR